MKETITKVTLNGNTLYAYVVGKSNNGLILYVQNRLIRVKNDKVEIIEDYIINLQFDLTLKKLEDEKATRAN